VCTFFTIHDEKQHPLAVPKHIEAYRGNQICQIKSTSSAKGLELLSSLLLTSIFHAFLWYNFGRAVDTPPTHLAAQQTGELPDKDTSGMLSLADFGD
jgi:hypothetical protein